MSKLISHNQDKPANHPAGMFLNIQESKMAIFMFLAAVKYLDFFNKLNGKNLTFEEITREFKLSPRPTDVMLSLFRAMKLIFYKNKRYSLTKQAIIHLTKESNLDLTAYYFTTQREDNICREMLRVMKTGRPASWLSPKDWQKELAENKNAQRFIKTMDCRGQILAPVLVQKISCKN